MTTCPELEPVLRAAYEMMDGSDEVREYGRRHGVRSAAILTVYDDERAALVAGHLSDRIRGKVVVEIGGGLGLLACHLAEHASRVFVIEANPVWASTYVAFLHRKKPVNLTFIFGSAEQMVGQIKGDVSLFCTCSDSGGMRRVASQFAPVVIDVYDEIAADLPGLAEWRAIKQLAEEMNNYQP